MRQRIHDARQETVGVSHPSIWRNPFLWAALAGLILIPLLRPLLRFEPPPPAVSGQLSSVRLTDQDGNPFEIPDSHGRVLVLSFFFTRCTTVCPTLGEGLASLSRRYAENGVDGVGLVSITVDPLHDGPQELKAWGEQHDCDGDRWRLLTGNPEAIRTLVESLDLEIGAPVDLPGDPPGRADVAHPDRLVLVDPAGRIRGLYHSDEPGRDEVFHRSRHVLQEGPYRAPIRAPAGDGF